MWCCESSYLHLLSPLFFNNWLQKDIKVVNVKGIVQKHVAEDKINIKYAQEKKLSCSCIDMIITNHRKLYKRP